MTQQQRHERWLAILIVNWILGLLAAILISTVVAAGIFTFKTKSEFWESFAKTQRQDRIPFASIPKPVLAAVLAAEGSDFFHCDKFTEFRLFYLLIFSRHSIYEPHCGITVAVARDVLFHQERVSMGIWHLKTAMAIYFLQARLTNQEIFEEFADRAYVGEGHRGLKEGAELMYRKPLSSLTTEEAAGLAAILKSPEMYSPRKHPERFKERQGSILKRVKDGGIYFGMDAGKP